MMDGKAAPGCVGRLRTFRQRRDEIAVIELNLIGLTLEILGRELKSGLREIDTVKWRTAVSFSACRIWLASPQAISRKANGLVKTVLSASCRRPPTALCESESASTSFW